MSGWLRKLEELHDRGQPCVIVTVAASKGSTPREAGAKMLVSAEAIYGTIGGGHLEFKAIEVARDILKAGDGFGASKLQRFPLGASLGQCCGGLATLLFEPISGAETAWVPTLARWQRDDVSCVMVTPAHGDSDRKLLVAASEICGALAGAALEERAIGIARQMLEAGANESRLLAIEDSGSSQSPLMLFE